MTSQSMNWKVLFASIPVAGILQYFNLTGEVVAIYAGIVVLDTLLGMYSQRKNGSEITSKILLKGVVDKITRLILPFLLVLVCRGANIDTESTTIAISSLMSLLIAGEGYSALRHIYNINTGQNLPEIDVLTLVIKKIAGIFKTKLPVIEAETPEKTA